MVGAFWLWVELSSTCREESRERLGDAENTRKYSTGERGMAIFVRV